MTKCECMDPIYAFRSPGEVQAFEAWLTRQISAESLRELPVERDAENALVPDRLIQWVSCGEKWVYERPDYPARGSFLPESMDKSSIPGRFFLNGGRDAS